MVNAPVFLNPSCPRCGKSVFGIKEFDVQGANYRHYAIICTACGCVVSTETMQDDDRSNRLLQALNNVSGQVYALSNQLNRVSNALRLKGFLV